MQFIVALLAAASVVWFLDDGCFPTISAAIQNLPASGEIRSGKLDWQGDPSQLLAEGKFMAFDVDLNHSGQIHSTADLQIEFGSDSIRFFSLLPGYSEIFYLPDRVAPFNRTELEPLWGAWAVDILFLAFIAVTLSLLSSWWLLATLYFLPVWLLDILREPRFEFLRVLEIVRRGAAAGSVADGRWHPALQLPVFLDLVSLGFLLAPHYVLGWIYLFLSQLFLPRFRSVSQRESVQMNY